MIADDQPFDDWAFALSQTPAKVRDAAMALVTLDRALEGAATRVRDPVLAAIRVQWWEDALRAPIPPTPADSIAAVLRAHDCSAVPIVEGWRALLDDPPDYRAHVRGRGAWLFEGVARVLGASPPDPGAGTCWAALRAVQRVGNAAAVPIARPAIRPLPRPLRTVLRLAIADYEAGKRGKAPDRGALTRWLAAR